jgi:hypothetical protein
MVLVFLSLSYWFFWGAYEITVIPERKKVKRKYGRTDLKPDQLFRRQEPYLIAGLGAQAGVREQPPQRRVHATQPPGLETW